MAKLSKDMAVLNKSIQAEFSLQRAETERLKNEATSAQEIASLSEQALHAAEDIVATQMDIVIQRRARSDRRFQLVVAFVSFCAGVLATLVIGVLSGIGD